MRVRKCCGEPGTLSEPRRGGGNGGEALTNLSNTETIINCKAYQYVVNKAYLLFNIGEVPGGWPLNSKIFLRNNNGDWPRL